MTWPKVKLGDVADFVNGAAFKPEDWGYEGKPIIRIQNLTGQSAPFNYTTRQVPQKFHVQNGDLLVSWSATLGVYEWQGNDALLNQHIFRVDFMPEKIDKSYLRRALDVSIDEMMGFTHGSTMKHINRGEFLATKIPLPPIAEQKRLAAILDRADELRRVRRQSLRVLDELAQSLFLELFGDPATNPKGWEVVRLGEAVKSLNGRRIPVESSIRATKEKIYRYYGASGIIDQIDGFIFDEETLLIGEDGANLLSRNSPIAFIVSGKYWVNNHAHVLKMKDQIEISYLCFLMNAIDLKPYVTGSAQPKLNAANLMNIEISLPPLSLQQQFAQQIEELEAIKMRTRASLLELDALFACLQARAFAGELSGANA